ncbi:WYL domain-containing protein [Sphaerospermopsis sp. LEGE 08334]|uniref:WYL domain-containing protein n=1 Tax=Sphaerospermopsis sp. LEGE 08334 TaxID=1828651 RepID=UPI0018802D25|nr:WYL domain-containing protein [Sphaerospermopsis sp. LEGE 08334]MBE9055023.1 WYL domain-containing protein [Sphaerospermopsis sp. LEGE 08334]
MSTPPICHFLIGVPGSGKSTFAAYLAKLGNYRVISTDAIRQQLYGDAAIQGVWTEIEAKVISEIVTAITEGICVIYDATNAKRAWRLNLLQKLDQKLDQKFNLAIASPILWMGWYLHTPIQTCKHWNKQRTRQVPEAEIDKMYQSLQDFPPVAAEGFAIIKEVDITSAKFNFQQISTYIQQLDRTLINRTNRNSQITIHAYSKLLDFERLMYLLSLIIRYPGIGNLQATHPSLLASLLGKVPEFTTSLEEITTCISQLFGNIYADEKAITADLLWLQKNSFIGVNTISSSSHTSIFPGASSITSVISLSTHPYSDFPAFQRLLQTIRFILHHPFLVNSGQGSLKTLVFAMQEQGIINSNVLDSVRKDIEKVLKPYQILPNFPMRDGYFAGTAILSQLELTQVFQVLQSQAQSLNDPIALEIYEKFATRMEKSKLGVSEVYPVRAIANRSMIDPEYLPSESLARNLPRVEEAIANGQLLELNRFPGGGKFAQDEAGFFLAFPLQIVFSNSAWYLGYECVSGKYSSLFRFERLDRLFIGKPQNQTRSRQQQETALKQLQILSAASGGIFLGYSSQDQQQFLTGNKQQRSQVCVIVELWFNDAMFRFVAEGTKRFPAQQMKMSLPVTGNKLNLPKAIFCLEKTEDNKFPHRFQIKLPQWCLEDIELLRWILGFKAGVKVVKPQLLVDKIKQIGEDMVNIYR